MKITAVHGIIKKENITDFTSSIKNTRLKHLNIFLGKFNNNKSYTKDDLLFTTKWEKTQNLNMAFLAYVITYGNKFISGELEKLAENPDIDEKGKIKKKIDYPDEIKATIIRYNKFYNRMLLN